MSEKHGDSNLGKQKNKLRWVLVALLIPLSIYLCGQAAWLMQSPADAVDIRSALSADYSPWTTAFFPGLDPSILIEAIRDRDQTSLLNPRRAVNCFLLTSKCETPPTEPEVLDTAPNLGNSLLRIVINEAHALYKADGRSVELHPGQKIMIDLRKTPLLIQGDDNFEADLLIYLYGDGQPWESLSLELSLKPEDVWVTLFSMGDQTHGDILLDLPYSMDAASTGGVSEAGALSDGASAQGLYGLAVDVDAAIETSGLYGWLRIGIDSVASAPVAIDAVVVLDPGDSLSD